MAGEFSLADFLRGILTVAKPKVIVAAGRIGNPALMIAEVARAQGFAKVIACGRWPDAMVSEKFATAGLSEWIEYRSESSLEFQAPVPIDLLYLAGGAQNREQELRHFLPQLSPGGVILMQDTGERAQLARESALKLEREGLISVVSVSSQAGILMAQSREGRDRVGVSSAGVSSRRVQTDVRPAERSLGGIIQPY